MGTRSKRKASIELEMNESWSSVPISSIANSAIGGTPSRGEPQYWGGTTPWATAKDVASVSGRYLHQVEEFITDKGLKSSAAKLMPEGTVVITARGTVGALAQLGQEMAFNQTCYAIVPSDELDNNFLFYALKGTLAEMRTLTYGSVFETITKRSFDNWRIPCPQLPVQRSIAHILGTLDDKIELNRRMNRTLEEMARAIFQDWFVDFGPTRAKMGGQEPYLPPELWDLFPDELVDSELGEIPEGWEVKPLDHLVTLNPKETMKKGIEAPYLDMASLPTDGCYPGKPVTRGFNSGSRFRNGDTLLARITPCLENGKTAYVHCLPNETTGWGSTEFIVMRGIPPTSPEYTYLLARNQSFRSHAILSMTGTSGRQRVQTEALATHLLPVPTEAAHDAFASTVQPLFRRIEANREEMDTLTAQRDALLPGLVSGRVSVTSV